MSTARRDRLPREHGNVDHEPSQRLARLVGTAQKRMELLQLKGQQMEAALALDHHAADHDVEGIFRKRQLADAARDPCRLTLARGLFEEPYAEIEGDDGCAFAARPGAEPTGAAAGIQHPFRAALTRQQLVEDD